MREPGDCSRVLAERARKLAEDIATREKWRIEDNKRRKELLQRQMETRRVLAEDKMQARAEKKAQRLAKQQNKIEREFRIRLHEERMLQDAVAKRNLVRDLKQATKIQPAIASLDEMIVLATPKPAGDPWTIIRQRHYSRPPYLGSLLRPPSDQQKMVRKA